MTASNGAIPEAVLALRRPQTVRSRAQGLLALARQNELRHFRLDASQIGPTADFVAETIGENYPDLAVPPHSRWRHFVVAGRDLWQDVLDARAPLNPAERARAEVDLALTSVLLDAGAGPDWRYQDGTTGKTYARSEGLAVASLRFFQAGGFSAEPKQPLRVDGSVLSSLEIGDLAAAFQVGPNNPLAGLEGRAGLMRALGQALSDNPQIFGQSQQRPGHLFDHLTAQGPAVRADALLVLLLDALESIWPGREFLQGHNLGDTWRHSQVAGEGESVGLLPLHKLSQWLTYSLIEPLKRAGLEVAALETLTGLAEYRNGGLLVDAGVLLPRDQALLQSPQAVAAEAIVEWRGLTVALLDDFAAAVRERLGRNADQLPLASVLEGGTWSAGRKLAARKRTDGGPPIQVVSDGTVF